VSIHFAEVKRFSSLYDSVATPAARSNEGTQDLKAFLRAVMVLLQAGRAFL
jgi:hypothetical protein